MVCLLNLSAPIHAKPVKQICLKTAQVVINRPRKLDYLTSNLVLVFLNATSEGFTTTLLVYVSYVMLIVSNVQAAQTIVLYVVDLAILTSSITLAFQNVLLAILKIMLQINVRSARRNA